MSMHAYIVYGKTGRKGWTKLGGAVAASKAAAIRQYSSGYSFQKGTKFKAVAATGAGNPGGRKLTKLQKRVKAAKASAKRRIATALATYLKQENPGRKIVGAKVVKGKGGRRSITPIFAKKGHKR